MGEAGAFTLDTAGELEREEDGRTWTLETGLQYEVSDRLQLLAETVLFERQEPDSGETMSGLGDTDLTLSWLAFEGGGALPATALAVKVKLPAAGKDEIDTEGVSTARAGVELTW